MVSYHWCRYIYFFMIGEKEMLITGDFFKFNEDVFNKYFSEYGADSFITFGVLIADCRQDMARQYIFNYLTKFDRNSSGYFDFFIPGYLHYLDKSENLQHYVEVSEKRYYFNEKKFLDFIEGLENNFGINYSHNPMLILISMIPGHMHTVQYIVIELDKTEYGIERCGELFERIFEVAKKDTGLEYLRSSIRKTHIKGNILNSLIRLFKISPLIEIEQIHGELKRYKIKNII